MHIPWMVLAIAFVLTLATQLFFRAVNGLSLSAAAVALVAGFWLLTALAARSVITRVRARRQKEAKP